MANKTVFIQKNYGNLTCVKPILSHQTPVNVKSESQFAGLHTDNADVTIMYVPFTLCATVTYLQKKRLTKASDIYHHFFKLHVK